MFHKNQILCIGLTLSLATNTNAHATVRIIQATELKSRLDTVQIADAREHGFETGHIPGSQSMMWKDWSVKKPNLFNYILGNERDWGKVISDPRQITKRLNQLGFSNDKEIVVVGNPLGWGEEGRIAWQFLYWGAKNVSILEGGFDNWKALHLPVESGKARVPKPGHFKVELNAARRALETDVKTNLMNHLRPLLDARSKEEFAGEKMQGQKRGGYIPGALSVPEINLYSSDGKYVTTEELQKILHLKSDSTPIAYCIGGVRSALLAVLIEARLGIITANYDGSIWEWSADPKLPLIK